MADDKPNERFVAPAEAIAPIGSVKRTEDNTSPEDKAAAEAQARAIAGDDEE